MSTPTAVCPVTRAWAPVFAGRSAILSRMVATRSFVAASDGPLAGMTVTVANWTAFSCCSSAAWSRGSSPATGGTTAATSVPIDRSSSTAVPTAATGSSAFLVSTTTTSGPLLPAPKFSEIRSYASRPSLPAGAVPLSGSASSIEATGIEITAAAARADDQGPDT